MTKSTISATALVAVGLTTTSEAAVTPAFTTPYTAGTTVFDGTPVITTNDNANSTTIPASNSNQAGFHGSASTATSFVSIGQTFTTTATGFNLDKLEFVLSGPAATALTINIYPVTGTTAGTNDGKGASAQAVVSSTGLLGTGGAGLTFNFPSAAGFAPGVVTLDFTGTDEVALAANTTYYAEVGGGNGGDLSLYRQGGGDFYSGGNAYGRNTAAGTPGAISGLGPRDASFAFYAATPEPSSLATLALGGFALIRRRRA